MTTGYGRALGALLAILFASSAEAQQVYYAHHPQDQDGGLTLVGSMTATTYTLTDLDTGGIVEEETIDRAEIRSIVLEGGHHYRLDADPGLAAYHGNTETTIAGSHFYPAEDGCARVGRSFVIWIPMLGGEQELFVIGAEDAEVTFTDAGSGAVVVSGEVTHNDYWVPEGLDERTVYIVSSTGNIALASAADTGYDVIPPLDFGVGGDAGYTFVFATRAAAPEGGAYVVWAFEDAEITMTDLVLGEPDGEFEVRGGSMSFHAPKGESYHLAESTGRVSLWATDVEGSSGVEGMGDDLAYWVSDGGLEVVAHSLSQGATIFAGADGTDLDIHYGPGESEAVSLDEDEWHEIDAFRFFTISATFPVLAQSIGGNALNDWGAFLRPIPRLDSDGDGISDANEGGACEHGSPDSDGDGRIDARDDDADGDRIPDDVEVGGDDIHTPPRDSDGDHVPDFQDTDSDNDTIADADEAVDGVGTPPVDSDSDGTPDYLDLDTDNDGIPDADEAGDDDLETLPVDTDDDGIPDFRDTDSDDDGVPDGDDCQPRDPDSYPGAEERCNGVDDDCDDNVDEGCPDHDGDGVPDSADDDDDDDGLTDVEEREAGTDPLDADSDDDGALDGDEPSWNEDSDYDGRINAMDPDSDDDGLPDGLELGVTEPSPDTDTTLGHFIPDQDPRSTTDPLDPDTDDGGVPDGVEDGNRNGAVDDGEIDPNVRADDASYQSGDSGCGGACTIAPRPGSSGAWSRLVFDFLP